MDDGRWKLATGTQRLTLATASQSARMSTYWLMQAGDWSLGGGVYKIGHPKRVVPVCSLLITRDDLRHLDALQCLTTKSELDVMYFVPYITCCTKQEQHLKVYLM